MSKTVLARRCSILGLAILSIGCAGRDAGVAGSGGQPAADAGGGGGGGGGDGSGGSAPTGSGGDMPGGSGGSTGGVIMVPKPEEFTKGDFGGFKLGDPIASDQIPSGTVVADTGGCNILVGVARDFRGKTETDGHPDFEAFQGCDTTKNLVADALGGDSKPVYASRCEAVPTDLTACPFGQMTTSKANFDQWYRLASGINKPFLVYLLFDRTATVATFASSSFFPLDGAGWGLSGEDLAGVKHNFGFTTEVHTKFKYNGAETFKFTGDDNLWVFINGKLAIDVGGLHPPVDGVVDLDAQAGALGLAKGGVYALDLFHAERHTEASNFRIDTNFSFVDCGQVIP